MKFIENCRIRKSYLIQDYEIHHIIPKAFDGSNDDHNLIKLTYREHFLAHMLLSKAFPGTNIGHAIYYFIYGSKSREIIKTSRQFELAKKIAGIKDSVWFNDGVNNYRIPNEVGISFNFKIGRISNKIWSNRICINNGLENKIIQKENLHSYLNSGYTQGMIKKYKVLNVTNGEINTAIPDSLLDEFLLQNKNWYIGQTVKSLYRKKDNCIRMHFNNLEKNIPKNEVDNYIKKGWEVGRSDKSKNSCSSANIQIYLNEENKRINEKELPIYLEQGWQLGIPNKRKEQNRKNNLGKIIIYNKNTGEEKRIFINELSSYEKNGWIRGRNPINLEKIKISRTKGNIPK